MKYQPHFPEQETYRPEIDGLRAVAVMAVVCFHAHLTMYDAQLLRGGYLGVDVFFVISGYLIARFIFRGLENGMFSLVDFYGRRARRILPALFLVLAVSFILAAMVLTPRPLIEFCKSLFACVLQVVACIMPVTGIESRGKTMESDEVPMLNKKRSMCPVAP